MGDAPRDAGCATALAAIEVSVDGGLWQEIETRERWEAKLTLGAGEHRVRIRARDTSGHVVEQTVVVKAQ